MKLSLLSSALLLLGTAAAEELIFGRSMRKGKAGKTSPVERIRQYEQNAVNIISNPIHWAKTSKTSKASKAAVSVDEPMEGHSSKTAKRSDISADRGFKDNSEPSVDAPRLSKAAKKAKVLAYSKASVDADAGVQEGPRLSKASKQAKASVYVFDESSMSYAGSLPFFDTDVQAKSAKKSKAVYDFDPSLDKFLSLSLSMPGADPSTTVAPPATTTPLESSADNEWGRLIFEYLSQCTGIELPIDSCLVSHTIDAVMSMDNAANECGISNRFRSLKASGGGRRFLQASNGGLRFLQDSIETGEECCPPEFTEQDLRPIMGDVKQQCVDEGFDVSDNLFESTLSAFLRMLANKDCWNSLCLEATDPTGLFFEILFGEAARCAGVEMTTAPCAMDHILSLLIGDGGDGGEVQDSSDPCDQPSEADFQVFALFMMYDAEAVCAEKNITLDATEWDKAVSDLVSIFSASQCWGISDCDEGLAAFPTESPVYDDEKGSRYVITEDGHECIFEIDTDPELERTIELSFFYRVETVSADEASLEGIEGALVELVCSDGRRSRALEEDQKETTLVAVNSSPDDVISADCKSNLFIITHRHPRAPLSLFATSHFIIHHSSLLQLRCLLA